MVDFRLVLLYNYSNIVNNYALLYLQTAMAHSNFKKRKAEDDLGKLLFPSDDELTNEGSFRTDYPNLAPGLDSKYPGINLIHQKFWTLLNSFKFAYLVTLNFEALFKNKRADSSVVHMCRPYKANTGGNLANVIIN